MLISCSRRTDIPAFYTDWFFNRIREGYVLVRNPMNSRQVRRVSLAPPDIECIEEGNPRILFRRRRQAANCLRDRKGPDS